MLQPKNVERENHAAAAKHGGKTASNSRETLKTLAFSCVQKMILPKYVLIIE